MNSKIVRRTVVASIATVAGVFGGMKLYANKRKKQQITLNDPEKLEEKQKKEES